MIFKIQRSISKAHGKPRILVYNKSLSAFGEFYITSTIKKLMGKELKIFAHGSFKNGIVNIDKLAKWQNW